jgi:hypothetical protein
VRVGIAHHLGWAVAVTASADHRVIDRRRIELVDPALPPAPVHHLGGAHEMHRPDEPLDDSALATVVAEVRASAATLSAEALADLVGAVPQPIRSISLVAWPEDFPDDIAVVRRVPYESRADSVMYRQVLAAAARERGWAVLPYDAKTVEAEATARLGGRAHDILHGPRATLGPPWSKDHRMALAATIVAG